MVSRVAVPGGPSRTTLAATKSPRPSSPLQGDLCITQPKGRVHSVNLIKAPPLFTLSKGRGEFWRLCQKKVRGLPGAQLRVTQRSLQGERRIRASSPEEGEGSSAQPPTGYAKLSGEGEDGAWRRGEFGCRIPGCGSTWSSADSRPAHYERGADGLDRKTGESQAPPLRRSGPGAGIWGRLGLLEPRTRGGWG